MVAFIKPFEVSLDKELPNAAVLPVYLLRDAGDISLGDGFFMDGLVVESKRGLFSGEIDDALLSGEILEGFNIAGNFHSGQGHRARQIFDHKQH